ncbi:hypothetical protein O6H91_17G051000 [Diphasiastrum complanatum]|uniref:Uncharacterized protein n=1 Tax=Diphasiastrum complanatum TaxID=34168 RepID=A0ACC2B6Q2_DIPCM|nr:hypothetical protein O6H91_17G051000 [Diphasiastrum complanatum]
MASSGMHRSVWILLFLWCVIYCVALVHSEGTWEVLVPNAGVSSMHAVVTRFGNVVIFDRTDVGPSKINLPNGKCRNDPHDLTLKHDCTAHSILFSPATNKIRPLFLQTDTWCSSGQILGDGTLVQTGGDFDGNTKIRFFAPCPDNGFCDWVESNNQHLQNGRWYATNQVLPDGNSQIVIGGRGAFTVEYVPANGRGLTNLPFLQQTNDAQHDNYYPFVHLLPDGNLFIFANRDSILYNYRTNRVLRKFPTIPGEPRNYPSAGSSVLLPLVAKDGYKPADVLICGGAHPGAFNNPAAFFPASQTCGRMTVTAPNPAWLMEEMPFRRLMGDMILLPTGDVLIINGALNGCQGWGNAKNAALNPVLYTTNGRIGRRFTTLAATAIARVYHSTANLLPDARILVAGSNTHQFYTFTGAFPTELRLEAFSPGYLNPAFARLRPTILKFPAVIKYNTAFVVSATIPTQPPGTVLINLVSASFTTHSYSHGQRLLRLAVTNHVVTAGHLNAFTAIAPPNNNVAPTSYYMLFVINNGIPSKAVWVKLSP